MCWNKDISINTFVFACLALTFIFFANTNTKYKTETFDSYFVYLFFLAVSSMQLIEYFLWKNLNNKFMNEVLSRIASSFIVLQQTFLILMIPDSTIRNGMLGIYTLFIMVFTGYIQINRPTEFHTSIGKNNHLSWEWMNYKGYDRLWLVIFLLFYILPSLFINKVLLASFIIVSMFASVFFYYKYETFGTMWCWAGNLFLLYFIVDILLIKPYYEYNGLC